MHYATPQDAEDAYYDALEAGDATAMIAVWESSDDTLCLLPMTPLALGPAVARLWQSILQPGAGFDLQVRHLRWIDCGELAIHLIEERSAVQSEGQMPPAIYGLNIFRRSADGWQMMLHQNSPTLPPSPAVPASGRTLMA